MIRKSGAQSSADQTDLKRIFESFLTAPADGDLEELPQTSDPDAQEYKMHLEVGDSTVFLKNTDPKTLITSLRHKLQQSNQKISIVVRQKKNESEAPNTDELIEKLRRAENEKTQLETTIEQLRLQARQAQTELEPLKANLMAAEARLKELEAVNADSHVAATDSDLRHLLKKAKKKLLIAIRQKENLTGTCDDQAKYIAELAQKLENLQSMKTQIEGEMESLRARHLLDEETQQRLEKMTAQLAAAQQTIAQLESAMSQKDQAVQSASHDADAARQQAALRQQEMAGLENTLRQAESQLTQRIEAARQYEAAVAGLKEEIAGLQKRLDQTNEEKTFLQTQLGKIEESDGRYHAAMEENRRLQEQLSTLRAQFNSVSSQFQKSDADLRQSLDQQHGMAQELRLERDLTAAFRQEAAQAKESLADAGVQLQKNEQARQALKVELDALGSQKQSLQDQIQTQTAAFEKLTRVHSELMDHSDNNQLEWQQAQTQMRQQIDSLSLRLQETENARRAAQLHLDELQLQHTALVEQTGGLNETLAARLDELNAGKQQLAQARADIEEASRRRGELESQLNDSRTTAQSLHEEKHRLQSSLAQSQAQIEALQTRKNEMNTALSQAADKIASLEETHRLLQAEYQHGCENICSLEGEKRDLQETAARTQADYEAHRAALTKQIASLETKVSELTSERDEYLDQVKQLRQTEMLYHDLQEKSRDLGIELETVTADLRSTQQELTLAEKLNVEKSEYQAVLEAELTEKENLLTQLRQEKQQLQEQLDVAKSQLLEAGETRRQLEANLASTQSALDESARNLAQTEESRRLTDQALQALQNEHQSLQDQLAQKRSQLTEAEALQAQTAQQLESTQAALDTLRQEHQALTEHLGEKNTLIEELTGKLASVQKDLSITEQTLESLRADYATAQDDLTDKQSRVESLTENLSQTRGRLDGTQQTLETLQSEHAAVQEELANKKSQMENDATILAKTQEQMAGTARALEAAQSEIKTLMGKMHQQADDHQNQLLGKDKQIQLLGDELKETTDCVAEFERLIHQVDAENADLRVNVEKTSEKIICIQEQTARQTELNDQLQKQVSEMRHSVEAAAEIEETLRLTKLQIRGLEQELAQEKDSHEATQRQLHRQKALDADLNEKIRHQAQEIKQVQQQMKDVLDNRQLVQTDLSEVGADPLKRKVMEMAAKIEALNLQLHERTNSLKQVQKQVQQLQEQGRTAAAAPAAPAPVQDAPKPVAQPAKPAPRPMEDPAAAVVENSPLSTGTARAQESIRKLRDELAQRHSHSQESQEKLSKAADELESLEVQSTPAAAPAKRSIQHKLNIFSRRS